MSALTRLASGLLRDEHGRIREVAMSREEAVGLLEERAIRASQVREQQAEIARLRSLVESLCDDNERIIKQRRWPPDVLDAIRRERS